MSARGQPSAPAPVCVATVTTPSYLPGTLVTLGSFVSRHPGMDTDLVVIHDGLEERERECLAVLPRLRFAAVSDELRGRLSRLAKAEPRLAARLAQFYSLEAFRLLGYRKVLFLDSDLLFRDRIDELFDRRAALLCCGDGPFHRDHLRNAATFDECAASDGAPVLERTFNAGFLLIGSELLDGSVYSELVAGVAAKNWAGNGTEHTDQLLYNRYFQGRQTLVGATYNYLLGHVADLRAREGLEPAQAKVLHFNGPIKPWQMAALAQSAAQPGATRFEAQAQCFRFWYDAWFSQLATLHLRSARRWLRRGGATA